MTVDGSTGMKPIGITLAAFVKAERDRGYRWPIMMGEWIDNSFGAGATWVRFDRDGKTVVISDNGHGCDDLYRMISIGESFRGEHNRASRYGVGGKYSQISATMAGRVEIVSVTKTHRHEAIVDWGAIVETGKDTPEKFTTIPRPPGLRRGTTITLYGCRQWYDPDQIARDLEYDYAYELANGRSITLRRGQETYELKAFQAPPLTRRIDFDLVVEGHRVTGFCGLVDPEHANPKHGFNFLWCHRFMAKARCSDPAEGRPTTRIYAEVHLPDDWDNHSPTKDDFARRPDELFDALAEACAEVIGAAEESANDFKLSSVTREAEAIIGNVLGQAARPKVKGARPGDAEKEGTAEPTGEGTPHREFTTTQDGDKAPAEEGEIAAKIPDAIRIYWDPKIEPVYVAEISGKRSRTITLTLNASNPTLLELQSNPTHLAIQCVTFIAYEVSFNEDKYRQIFPAFADREFQKVLKRLFGDLLISRSDADGVAA